MKNFRVTVTVGDVTDSTDIEAETQGEAVFLSGAVLGAALAVANPNAALAYRMLGIGAVQSTIEDIVREDLNSLSVEEL